MAVASMVRVQRPTFPRSEGREPRGRSLCWLGSSPGLTVSDWTFLARVINLDNTNDLSFLCKQGDGGKYALGSSLEGQQKRSFNGANRQPTLLAWYIQRCNGADLAVFMATAGSKPGSYKRGSKFFGLDTIERNAKREWTSHRHCTSFPASRQVPERSP
jgi:hypothetical protein